MTAAAVRLLAFVRKHTTGDCRVVSKGGACTCPLCDVHRLIALSESSGATKRQVDMLRRVLFETGE